MPYKYKRPGSPFYYIGFTDKEKKYGFKNFSTKLKSAKQVDELIVELKIKIKEIKKLNNYIPESNLLLSEAFKIFLIDREAQGKKLSELTINNYNIALKHLFKIVGNKIIINYTKQDYYAFINSLKNCKHNTKSAYSRCLYALFNWLLKEKFISENPMQRIREQQKEVIIKTKNEIKKLLEYAQNTKFYWFVRFQLESAFRLNEVLTTTKDKIEKDIIRVNRKGNIPNMIPITKRMKKLLNEMPMPSAPDGRLFPFTRKNIYQFFERFRKATGINITSHDLRKYTLSKLANAGIPINYTKDYAGHTDIKTTMKYYIRSDKIKMVQVIDEKLKDDEIV